MQSLQYIRSLTRAQSQLVSCEVRGIISYIHTSSSQGQDTSSESSTSSPSESTSVPENSTSVSGVRPHAKSLSSIAGKIKINTEFKLQDERTVSAGMLSSMESQQEMQLRMQLAKNSLAMKHMVAEMSVAPAAEALLRAGMNSFK